MDGSVATPAPLTELSRAECLDALASSAVGRVAVTSHALPAVVPVNYALAGSSIVFRTRSDGLLARACDGAVVAFEVDELSRDGRTGWSVLVVGVATLLDGSAALRATELNLVSAAGTGRDTFVGIAMGQVSGRRIGAADATVGSFGPAPR